MAKAKEGVVAHDKPGKAYNAQGSNVEHEAEEKAERKRGGHCERAEGGAAEEGAEERAHGGGLDAMKKKKKKEEGKAEGEHNRPRFDRPGRKRGGAIGANLTPLSTAAKITPAEGRKDVDGDRLDEEEG